MAGQQPIFCFLALSYRQPRLQRREPDSQEAVSSRPSCGTQASDGTNADTTIVLRYASNPPSESVRLRARSADALSENELGVWRSRRPR